MRQKTYKATVRSTFIGIEDHGFFCVNIDFDYDGGCSQGTGCYTIPGLMAEKAIKSYLKLFNISSWEELKGKRCQVRCDDGFIKAMRLKDEDDWTELAEIFSEDDPMKAFRLLHETGNNK